MENGTDTEGCGRSAEFACSTLLYLLQQQQVPPSEEIRILTDKSFQVDQQTAVSTFHPAQSRSSFCIFHLLNEISQHPELMDTFLVGNHYHISLGRLSNQMQSTFQKALMNTIKSYCKKWPQNGPLSCYVNIFEILKG